MNLIRSFTLALMAGVALVGCNVFEGLYEAGTSNDPVVLMVDADQALQAGDPEKAVVILEKAVEKAPPMSPQRVEAEVKLSSAKLQAAKVSVIQFQRLADDLNTRIENASSGKGSVVTSGVCSFAAPDRAIERIHLNQLDAFDVLTKNQTVLAEAQRLALTGVVRNYAIKTRKDFSLSTSDEELEQWVVEVWSGLHDLYRRGELKSSLVEEASAVLVPALTNIALGRAGKAYFDLNAAGGDVIEWYTVHSPVDGNYLGYCAPSQEVLDQLEQETACVMSDIEMAVEALEFRSAFFDRTSVARELAESAREGYNTLRKELKGTCGG